MSQYLDIIILLVVVVLIFQKLKTLLGTRPDMEERQQAEIKAAKILTVVAQELEKQQQKIQQPVQAVQNKTNTVTPVKQDYDNYTYIPSQDSAIPKTKSEYDNYTYIPSQDSVFSTKNDNINKYIPAQTPANIKKTFDNSGLASALKRADRAEANAIKILSGKFPGS